MQRRFVVSVFFFFFFFFFVFFGVCLLGFLFMLLVTVFSYGP